MPEQALPAEHRGDLLSAFRALFYPPVIQAPGVVVGLIAAPAQVALRRPDTGLGVLGGEEEPGSPGSRPAVLRLVGQEEGLGIEKDHIFILKTGDVLEIDDESAKVTGHVQTGSILVDGLGVGDVGNIVLRDRQHLSEDGIMVVVLTLEKRTNQLLAGPDIVSRGFVYVRESEDLMGEAREVVEEALDGCLSKNISDWGKIKSTIKDALGDYVWKKTKRRPMILPIIMDV